MTFTGLILWQASKGFWLGDGFKHNLSTNRVNDQPLLKLAQEIHTYEYVRIVPYLMVRVWAESFGLALFVAASIIAAIRLRGVEVMD